MTPEEEIQALKAIILALGDGAAGVIEQMIKGNWVDDQGHPVCNNIAMIKLGNALVLATKHAEENGG